MAKKKKTCQKCCNSERPAHRSQITFQMKLKSVKWNLCEFSLLRSEWSGRRKKESHGMITTGFWTIRDVKSSLSVAINSFFKLKYGSDNEVFQLNVSLKSKISQN